MQAPKIIVEVVQNTNPWWALSLVILPVFLTFFLAKKKTLPKKKGKP